MQRSAPYGAAAREGCSRYMADGRGGAEPGGAAKGVWMSPDELGMIHESSERRMREALERIQYLAGRVNAEWSHGALLGLAQEMFLVSGQALREPGTLPSHDGGL